MRTNTVINLSSKKQEEDLGLALKATIARLEQKHRLYFSHESIYHIKDLVRLLRSKFPQSAFEHVSENSSIRPDGGILSVLDKEGKKLPILISEVKGQGTNDQRAEEGLDKQSMGNAIERLGKNVIAFRMLMAHEKIFPFVCFGSGCDFEPPSSILDRVAVIALFGKLNHVHLQDEKNIPGFKRGSFYFRNKKWSVEEMADVMFEIADRSIDYYLAAYGADSLLQQ